MLARKWRPRSFANMVGQAHVLTTLANGLELGRIHHAYLFSGTRGVGKTSIARLMAKCLNCEIGITAMPCSQCNNCCDMENGCFIDLIEIDAASRTKVEDTRDLLDNVQYAPAQGRFKVYLIDEIHMLSRHSFNALLKTLEEPPAHVKFLLVTTDIQKLPSTILSRCLQFHLKALDLEQIQHQLVYVLQKEQIEFEQDALYLLARAADGSMRDALSLTDQAISMGQGRVMRDVVKQMLGILDDEQPLSLIEALTNGQGEQVMLLLNQASLRGVEWESMLVEMLRLLHCIAMLQLLPSSLSDHDFKHAQRLHDLARFLPPADVQLYYQILLMGRKDLALAPSHRLGVEMTLLRALAFYPQATIAESMVHQSPIPDVTPQVITTKTTIKQMPITLPVCKTSFLVNNYPDNPSMPDNFPQTTNHIVQARTQPPLRNVGCKVKQSESKALPVLSVNSAFEQRLASVTDHVKQRVTETDPALPVESHHCIAHQQAENVIAPPKALISTLEHEKKPELIQRLAEEARQRDAWAAEIGMLTLPKMVQQVALNTWKEANDKKVILHLRSRWRHLNSTTVRQILQNALSQAAGQVVELTIIEDDNLAVLTPLEWRQVIYKEKLAQAHQSIKSDNHIQMLRRFFDASLDQESIQPV